MGLCEGLPIIIAEGAKVLILGSMPGNVSLAKGEYYGNRNNHFWSIMFAILGVQEPQQSTRIG